MSRITIQFGQLKKNLLFVGIVTSFSACGVLPVSNDQSSDDDIFFEQEVTIVDKKSPVTEVATMAPTPVMFDELE